MRKTTPSAGGAQSPPFPGARPAPDSLTRPVSDFFKMAFTLFLIIGLPFLMALAIVAGWYSWR